MLSYTQGLFSLSNQDDLCPTETVFSTNKKNTGGMNQMLVLSSSALHHRVMEPGRQSRRNKKRHVIEL